MQEKIKYSEVMNLGFVSELLEDSIYFNKFGYDCEIIYFNLTKKLIIYWTKETQLCEMIRINRQGDVLSGMLIQNLEHLKEMINFFSEIKFTDWS